MRFPRTAAGWALALGALTLALLLLPYALERAAAAPSAAAAAAGATSLTSMETVLLAEPQAPAAPPSPSRSASPTPSPTPSPSPSRSAAPAWPPGTRVLRRVAATGPLGLPEVFSVPPGAPLPRTRHRCTGRWLPLQRQGNRSCEFEGLLLDVAHTVLWRHYAWAYLALAEDAPPAVAAAAAAGNASAALLAWARGVREDAHVGAAGSNREADQWYLEVAVYQEDREGPGGALPRALPPPPPLDPAPGPFARTFFAQRCVPANIGHQLFEEYLPVFGALADLGHEGAQGEYGLLEIDHADYPGEGFHAATQKCYDGVTPRFAPLLAGQWLPQAQAALPPQAQRLIAFPSLAAGLMGRSCGGYNADFAPPGHERGLLWRFRNHYLAGLGVGGGSDVRDWAALGGARGAASANRSAAFPLPASAPLNIMLLQKVRKRAYANAEEVRDAIAAAHPGARVWIQRWEDLGFDHVAEARLLANTSVLISMSGTGINTAFLLPRGSVVINTGAPIAHRVGHVGGAFMHGNAHVRYLHYQGMAPEDADGAGQDASVRLPLDKFLPLVGEAVAAWRGGFATPVPWPENHSPQGKLVACLLHRYPEAQWWASFWQGTRGTDAANEMNANPRAWFEAAAANVNDFQEGYIAARGYARAPGWALPRDFDASAAACAVWAGAWTREVLPAEAVRNASSAMPPWVAARAAELAASAAQFEAEEAARRAAGAAAAVAASAARGGGDGGGRAQPSATL
jgi:hypothetical protein